MKRLFLEDLSELNVQTLKQHLITEYDATSEMLQGAVFLIAYESVGSWGCDSSSFFLFKQKGKLYEVHGSHCSCYGFEGQWEPEETSVVALKERALKGHVFCAGGYDDNGTHNQKLVTDYVLKMR